MDRYHLMDVVGEGSFGKVYKGRRKYTGHLVAMKFLVKKGKSLKELSALRSEMAILSKLRHDNVTLMLDWFETKDEICVVTEFAPGELFEMLERDKSLPESTVRTVAIQMVSALHYLHSNRIVHRDLKPQNILVGHNAEVKICDFGFARSLSNNTFVMQSFKGTPLYMAPELINEQPYNHTVDLWSLGCILYELATGDPPFYSTTFWQLAQIISDKSVKFPKSMSSDLRSLLSGLLQKDPKKRLQWPDLMQHPFVVETEEEKRKRTASSSLSLSRMASIDPFVTPRFRMESNRLDEEIQLMVDNHNGAKGDSKEKEKDNKEKPKGRGSLVPISAAAPNGVRVPLGNNGNESKKESKDIKENESEKKDAKGKEVDRREVDKLPRADDAKAKPLPSSGGSNMSEPPAPLTLPPVALHSPTLSPTTLSHPTPASSPNRRSPVRNRSPSPPSANTNSPSPPPSAASSVNVDSALPLSIIPSHAARFVSDSSFIHRILAEIASLDNNQSMEQISIGQVNVFSDALKLLGNLAEHGWETYDSPQTLLKPSAVGDSDGSFPPPMPTMLNWLTALSSPLGRLLTFFSANVSSSLISPSQKTAMMTLIRNFINGWLAIDVEVTKRRGKRGDGAKEGKEAVEANEEDNFNWAASYKPLLPFVSFFFSHSPVSFPLRSPSDLTLFLSIQHSLYKVLTLFTSLCQLKPLVWKDFAASLLGSEELMKTLDKYLVKCFEDMEVMEKEREKNKDKKALSGQSGDDGSITDSYRYVIDSFLHLIVSLCSNRYELSFPNLTASMDYANVSFATPYPFTPTIKSSANPTSPTLLPLPCLAVSTSPSSQLMQTLLSSSPPDVIVQMDVNRLAMQSLLVSLSSSSSSFKTFLNVLYASSRAVFHQQYSSVHQREYVMMGFLMQLKMLLFVLMTIEQGSKKRSAKDSAKGAMSSLSDYVKVVYRDHPSVLKLLVKLSILPLESFTSHFSSSSPSSQSFLSYFYTHLRPFSLLCLSHLIVSPSHLQWLSSHLKFKFSDLEECIDREMLRERSNSKVAAKPNGGDILGKGLLDPNAVEDEESLKGRRRDFVGCAIVMADTVWRMGMKKVAESLKEKEEKKESINVDVKSVVVDRAKMSANDEDDDDKTVSLPLSSLSPMIAGVLASTLLIPVASSKSLLQAISYHLTSLWSSSSPQPSSSPSPSPPCLPPNVLIALSRPVDSTLSMLSSLIQFHCDNLMWSSSAANSTLSLEDVDDVDAVPNPSPVSTPSSQFFISLDEMGILTVIDSLLTSISNGEEKYPLGMDGLISLIEVHERLMGISLHVAAASGGTEKHETPSTSMFPPALVKVLSPPRYLADAPISGILSLLSPLRLKLTALLPSSLPLYRLLRSVLSNLRLPFHSPTMDAPLFAKCQKLQYNHQTVKNILLALKLFRLDKSPTKSSPTKGILSNGALSVQPSAMRSDHAVEDDEGGLSEDIDDILIVESLISLLGRLMLCSPFFLRQFIESKGLPILFHKGCFNASNPPSLLIECIQLVSQLARTSAEFYEDFHSVEELLYPSILSLLQHGDPIVRGKVCNFIGNLCRHSNFFYEPLKSANVLPLLVEAVGDPNGNVRKFASCAVGNAAFHSPILVEDLMGGIPNLLKCLTEGEKTKANAAGAIGNLVRNSDKAVGEMLKNGAMKKLMDVVEEPILSWRKENPKEKRKSSITTSSPPNAAHSVPRVWHESTLAPIRIALFSIGNFLQFPSCRNELMRSSLRANEIFQSAVEVYGDEKITKHVTRIQNKLQQR